MRLMLLCVLAAVLVMQPVTAAAYHMGANSFSGKPPARYCTNCHQAGAATPTIALAGPTKLAPGGHGAYTVTIAGGPGVTAGVDVAVSATAATLSPGTGTKLQSKEVVQSDGTPFAGGEVVYDFGLTAPSTPGTITLYACGLSSNGDHSTGVGDGTKATTMDVEISSDGDGDAGEPDSGIDDAGSSDEDASTPSADASVADAGTDGGAPDADGTPAQVDSGPPPGDQDNTGETVTGCGCGVASRANSAAVLIIVFVLALAWRLRPIGRRGR